MFSYKIRVLTLAVLCTSAGLAQITLNQLPTREIGQPQTARSRTRLTCSTFNPNLVEGREFFNPVGLGAGYFGHPAAGSTSPIPATTACWPGKTPSTSPTANRPTWSSASAISSPRPPLGPGRNPSNPLSTGFTLPSGLAVFQGDLYVADAGNNRVLRFRKPFAATDQFPDLCIGQPNFNSTSAQLSRRPGEQPHRQGHRAEQRERGLHGGDHLRHRGQPLAHRFRQQPRFALRRQRHLRRTTSSPPRRTSKSDSSTSFPSSPPSRSMASAG